MDPVTGSVVTALAGLGVHVIALVREELRLRWAARRERERAGCRCVGVQVDGGEVRPAISGESEEAGRGSA